MESLFDVVVSEPLTLDAESDRSVFFAWVRGLSARDVVTQRLAKFQAQVEASRIRMGKIQAVSGAQLSFRRRGSTIEETPQEEAASQRSQLEELFYKDTADAFRVFDTMEHFLCQPEYLRGQIQVQLGSATQMWMVEKYHELDDSVLREIIGKRVTSKTRKDLDDVSELTRVPLRSCRRQYDNIRRVLSSFEDSAMLQHISVAREIQDKMGLPLWLAAKYTASVFLLHLRFQTQGSRRSTAHMTAEDLCWSAMGMLNYWVGTGEYLGAYEEALQEAEAKTGEIKPGGENSGVEDARQREHQRAMEEGLLDSHGLELDKSWIRMLRIIKSQLSGDSRNSLFDMLHQSTMEELQNSGQPEAVLEACSSLFRSTVKALASIGSGLSMSKEYRGVFDDLIEKVGNPLRDSGLGLRSISILLEALVRGFNKASAGNVPNDTVDQEMVGAWKRYLYGVRVFFRYAYKDNRSTGATFRARTG